MKIGWVPFINLVPMRYEFKQLLSSQSQLTLNEVEAVPKGLNQLLLTKEIDAGPCSSICLANESLKIFSPAGVIVKNKIQSVYLATEHSEVEETIQKRQIELQRFSKQENFFKRLSEIRENTPDLKHPQLVFSQQSQTSVALSKVVASLWFGCNYFKSNPESKTKLHLLIGDEAIQKKENFKHLIDLGEIWHSLFKLPFVFSLWQSQQGFNQPQLSKLILKSAQLAEKKMHADPDFYFDQMTFEQQQTIQNSDAAAHYWQQLRYVMNEQDHAALELFLKLFRSF